MRHLSIKELAAQLSRTSLDNPDAHAVVVSSILGARDRLRPESEDLAGVLHAAAVLVRSIPNIRPDAGVEIQKMTVRLIRIVARACETTLDAEQTGTIGNGDAQLGSSGPAALRALNDMSIGQVLVQLGFATEDDVDQALQLMVTTKKRLGETLCDMGKVSEADVESAINLRTMLSESASKNAPPSPIGSVLLGEIMLEHEMIDRAQLDDALNAQRESGKCIGETLVQIGAASWTDVTEAIREQARRGGPAD